MGVECDRLNKYALFKATKRYPDCHSLYYMDISCSVDKHERCNSDLVIGAAHHNEVWCFIYVISILQCFIFFIWCYSIYALGERHKVFFVAKQNWPSLKGNA